VFDLALVIYASDQARYVVGEIDGQGRC
jgi:hypothetical protein